MVTSLPISAYSNSSSYSSSSSSSSTSISQSSSSGTSISQSISRNYNSPGRSWGVESTRASNPIRSSYSPIYKNTCSSGSITLKKYRCSSGSIIVPLNRKTTIKKIYKSKASYYNNPEELYNNNFNSYLPDNSINYMMLVNNASEALNNVITYKVVALNEIKEILLKRIPSKYRKNIHCRTVNNEMVYLCDIEKVKGVIYQNNDKYWEIINIRISKTYTHSEELKLDITISAIYANNTFSEAPEEKSGSYKPMEKATVDKYREYLQNDIEQYFKNNGMGIL